MQCRPYEREVIFSIGKHYKTNETLPEELYEKIAAARNYRSVQASFATSALEPDLQTCQISSPGTHTVWRKIT